MMVDVHNIQTTSEVFDLYLKQKSEFHFQQKSDNDFIVFLLDTAIRVISIVQHLSPVIEAVSDASIAVPDSMMYVDLDERRPEPMLPNSKRPCLREPHILGLSLNSAGPSEVNTDLIDQQISHHNSEYRQLEKELETLTQSLCEEVALNNAVSKAAHSVTSSLTLPTDTPCQDGPLTTFPAGTSSVPPPQTPSPGSIPGPATHTAATKDPPLGDTAMETDSSDTAKHNSETSNREPSSEKLDVKEEPAEVKVKKEQCDVGELENDKNNINNNNNNSNTFNSVNNGSNALVPNSECATDHDTERLAAAVLSSVTNLNSVSNFLGSLSQLSMPGPSTQVHSPSISGCKTFDCSFCDFTTLDKMDYVKHIREHTGEKPYTCQICDYRSDHRGNLVIHMRTHTQGRLYHCKLCSFRTSRRMYLHEHMESHAVEEKPYVCLLCDYRTARKANLGIHMGSQKHIASVMKAKVMGQNPQIDNKTS